MEIPKKIKDEIWDYCHINDIPNIDEFMLKMISQGFTVEKYGAAPAAKERVVEKIIEKIVEREVLITNDEAFTELTDKIAELELKLINTSSELNSEYAEKLKEKEDKITLLTNLLDIEKKKKRDIYGE